MYKCRVVIEKIRRGWQIKTVGGDWISPGCVMMSDGYFGSGLARVFLTRAAARKDIRRYTRLLKHVKITGGLH